VGVRLLKRFGSFCSPQPLAALAEEDINTNSGESFILFTIPAIVLPAM